MTDRAFNLERIWDLGHIQACEATHAWVLSAMRRHGPGLVSLLWRILANEQDVCDAYQDVFLQLAHAPNRPKPNHTGGYLYRTAANVAISMIRRRKVRQNALERLNSQCQTEHHVDYAQELDTTALCTTMRSHICRLPEHLRNTLILRDLAELPYSRVAEIMGISLGTARVFRCRALKILAQWMAQKKE